MVIVAIILGAFFGFGITLAIVAKMVDKSNNLGDSVGDYHSYSEEMNYSYKKDKISSNEMSAFMKRGTT